MTEWINLERNMGLNGRMYSIECGQKLWWEAGTHPEIILQKDLTLNNLRVLKVPLLPQLVVVKINEQQNFQL